MSQPADSSEWDAKAAASFGRPSELHSATLSPPGLPPQGPGPQTRPNGVRHGDCRRTPADANPPRLGGPGDASISTRFGLTYSRRCVRTAAWKAEASLPRSGARRAAQPCTLKWVPSSDGRLLTGRATSAARQNRAQPCILPPRSVASPIPGIALADLDRCPSDCVVRVPFRCPVINLVRRAFGSAFNCAGAGPLTGAFSRAIDCPLT
jgi:hypothetical protein